MKNVLITGGCGFIGSHVVREISRLGCAVDVVDDLSSSTLDRIEDIDHTVTPIALATDDVVAERRRRCPVNVFLGDFASTRVLSLVSRGDYDCIVNLAAVSSVSPTVRDPIGSSDVNVSRTIRVVGAAATCGRRVSVVHASSSAVYGDANYIVTEEDGCDPISPYGAQKLAAEIIMRQIVGLSDSVSCALGRFFNVYGPGQNSSGTGAGVASIWSHALARGETAKCFGDPERMCRDFVHVDDAVRAILLMIDECDKEKLDCEKYNVASGKKVTLATLADSIQLCASMRLNVDIADREPHDPVETCGHSGKIRFSLGWSPKVEFDAGIRDVWNHEWQLFCE